MPKITELPSNSTTANNDLVPMVDLSGTVTQKITLQQLAAAMTSYFASKAISVGSIDLNGLSRLHARRSTSTQVIPTATLTTVIFNDVSEADGSAYNSSTGVYTAPSTGLYTVQARVTFQESLAISLRVVVNGSVVSSEDTPATGTYTTKSISMTVRVTAGQTIAVVVYHSAGTNRNIHTDPVTTNLTITRFA